MTVPAPFTLDVRPELRNGGEPLGRILAAVKELAAGQTLRLLTTFEPIPLYTVLGQKGFSHVASRHSESDWEILFVPGEREATAGAGKRPAPARVASETASGWPAPKTSLDNRGLLPPEPMIRILDTLEHLAPGEVLEAINERDPAFLYPELAARGAAITTERQADGSVRLLIRRGG